MAGPDLHTPVAEGTGAVDPRPGADASDTEHAILDAARDLLAAGGIGAVSMRAVASRVGLSATAIYHYFDSKEALVDRVVQHGFQRSEEYMWKAIEPLPVGSLERVAAMGEAYIRFALGNRQYFKIIFAIRPEQPRAITDVPGQGGYRVLRQCVVDAMESGAMRRSDPDTVVLYLWSVVHGLVTIFMACDPASMLPEVGLPAEDGTDVLVILFRRFREVVEGGLAGPAAQAGTDGADPSSAGEEGER